MAEKTITIDVIAAADVEFIKTDKGGYNRLEIPFKDNGKVSGKKLIDFNNKGLFEQVKSLQKGDRCEVGMQKEEGSDGREYWNWKTIRVLGDGEEATAPSVSTPSQAAPQETKQRAGKVLGSTYETPEERALKQVLIVRQSSLTTAQAYLNQGGGYSLEELEKAAEKISRWVFDNGRLVPPALVQVPEGTVAEVVSPASESGEAPKKRGRPSTKKEPLADVDEDIPF